MTNLTRAVALALAAAISLTACSGSGIQLYQEAGGGWQYLRIDGDEVKFVEPSCDTILQGVSDIESGKTDPNIDYNLQIGSLTEARDTVIWSDGEDDPIEIADDLVSLNGRAFIDYRSEQAESLRKEALAEAC